VPRVILITGPSGAGKSTTSRAFAERRSAPTALLDQDHIRTFIASGFARPDRDWDEESERQWRLAKNICLDAITRYADAGFEVVIDAYAPATEGTFAWAHPTASVERVVLLPRWDVIVERNAMREAALDIEPLRRNYESFEGSAGDDVIDNSELSVEETVAAIRRVLGE
jgi:cytidylate kinase